MLQSLRPLLHPVDARKYVDLPMHSTPGGGGGRGAGRPQQTVTLTSPRTVRSLVRRSRLEPAHRLYLMAVFEVEANRRPMNRQVLTSLVHLLESEGLRKAPRLAPAVERVCCQVRFEPCWRGASPASIAAQGPYTRPAGGKCGGVLAGVLAGGTRWCSITARPSRRATWRSRPRAANWNSRCSI